MGEAITTEGCFGLKRVAKACSKQSAFGIFGLAGSAAVAGLRGISI